MADPERYEASTKPLTRYTIDKVINAPVVHRPYRPIVTPDMYQWLKDHQCEPADADQWIYGVPIKLDDDTSTPTTATHKIQTSRGR